MSLQDDFKKSLEASVNLLKNVPSRDEFLKSFQSVVALVVKVEQTLIKKVDDKLSTIDPSINDAIASIKALKDDGDLTLEDVKKQATAIIEKQIARIDARISTIQDGEKGEDGKDADETKIIAEVLKQIPPDVEETPIETRDKLETLEGNDRLDKSAVKGIDELEKEIQSIKIRPTRGLGGAKGFTLYIGGAKKLLTAQTLNLVAGAGISLTYAYANGRNDVTISAGAAALTLLTATGTVDNSNTAFTFISKPNMVIVNGASYRENNGWTWNGGTLTATLANPVGVGGDIYGI